MNSPKKKGACDFKNINNFTEEEFKIVTLITKHEFNQIFQICLSIQDRGLQRFVSEIDLLTFLSKMCCEYSSTLKNSR